MHVSFQYKLQDLVAFNLFHVFRSPVFLGLAALLLFGGAVPNWQTAGSAGAGGSPVSQIALFVILELLPVTFMIVMLAGALLMTNIRKMNQTVPTESRITLSRSGILTETSEAYSEIGWSMVQRAAQTRSHIFVYLTQRGALVIPKRAFTSAAESERFVALCRAKGQADGAQAARCND